MQRSWLFKVVVSGCPDVSNSFVSQSEWWRPALRLSVFTLFPFICLQVWLVVYTGNLGTLSPAVSSIVSPTTSVSLCASCCVSLVSQQLCLSHSDSQFVCVPRLVSHCVCLPRVSPTEYPPMSPSWRCTVSPTCPSIFCFFRQGPGHWNPVSYFFHFSSTLWSSCLPGVLRLSPTCLPLVTHQWSPSCGTDVVSQLSSNRLSITCLLVLPQLSPRCLPDLVSQMLSPSCLQNFYTFCQVFHLSPRCGLPVVF